MSADTGQIGHWSLGKPRWAPGLALVCWVGLFLAATASGQTPAVGATAGNPQKGRSGAMPTAPTAVTVQLARFSPGRSADIPVGQFLARSPADRNVGAPARSPEQLQTLYTCDFEAATVDKVPEDFLVLDGAFAVKSDGKNKYLELPGAPVDSYGVLFGPTGSNDVAVAARIYGTSRGRRQPVFGVGLNGAGGLRLMVAPGREALELFKGDDALSRSPYRWESGKWTFLRLQVRRLEDGAWQAEGKAWSEGSPEPATWQISYKENSELTPGKAAVWGSPISGTPIRFDDLKVMTAGKSVTSGEAGSLKR